MKWMKMGRSGGGARFRQRLTAAGILALGALSLGVTFPSLIETAGRAVASSFRTRIAGAQSGLTGVAASLEAGSASTEAISASLRAEARLLSPKSGVGFVLDAKGALRLPAPTAADRPQDSLVQAAAQLAGSEPGETWKLITGGVSVPTILIVEPIVAHAPGTAMTFDAEESRWVMASGREEVHPAGVSIERGPIVFEIAMLPGTAAAASAKSPTAATPSASPSATARSKASATASPLRAVGSPTSSNPGKQGTARPMTAASPNPVDSGGMPVAQMPNLGTPALPKGPRIGSVCVAVPLADLMDPIASDWASVARVFAFRGSNVLWSAGNGPALAADAVAGLPAKLGSGEPQRVSSGDSITVVVSVGAADWGLALSVAGEVSAARAAASPTAPSSGGGSTALAGLALVFGLAAGAASVFFILRRRSLVLVPAVAGAEESTALREKLGSAEAALLRERSEVVTIQHQLEEERIAGEEVRRRAGEWEAQSKTSADAAARARADAEAANKLVSDIKTRIAQLEQHPAPDADALRRAQEETQQARRDAQMAGAAVEQEKKRSAELLAELERARPAEPAPAPVAPPSPVVAPLLSPVSAPLPSPPVELPAPAPVVSPVPSGSAESLLLLPPVAAIPPASPKPPESAGPELSGAPLPPMFDAAVVASVPPTTTLEPAPATLPVSRKLEEEAVKVETPVVLPPPSPTQTPSAIDWLLPPPPVATESVVGPSSTAPVSAPPPPASAPTVASGTSTGPLPTISDVRGLLTQLWQIVVPEMQKRMLRYPTRFAEGIPALLFDKDAVSTAMIEITRSLAAQTPEGGVLEFSAKWQTGTLELSFRHTLPIVEVGKSDPAAVGTDLGIPEESLDEVAERAGGHLSVERQAGRYAVYRFTLSAPPA